MNPSEREPSGLRPPGSGPVEFVPGPDEFAPEDFGPEDFDDAGTASSDTAAAQRRLVRRMLAGIGALILVVLAGSGLAAVLHRPEPGVEYRYVIPHGTAERIAAREPVEVLPARIELRTQDTLVLENEDHEPFSVGGLRVGAGQTMTYRWSEPGNYGGSCELHNGGKVDIVVV